jgi:acetaldehyde dehydrogenase (acetylating)
VAFLEPSQARALTEAQVIALQGLASVIGPEKVGLIEVLKHVDISHVSMNPFTGTIPIVQPVIDALHQQTQKALPPGIPKGLPPDPNEPKSR